MTLPGGEMGIHTGLWSRGSWFESRPGNYYNCCPETLFMKGISPINLRCLLWRTLPE